MNAGPRDLRSADNVHYVGLSVRGGFLGLRLLGRSPAGPTPERPSPTAAPTVVPRALLAIEPAAVPRVMPAAAPKAALLLRRPMPARAFARWPAGSR